MIETLAGSARTSPSNNRNRTQIKILIYIYICVYHGTDFQRISRIIFYMHYLAFKQPVVGNNNVSSQLQLLIAEVSSVCSVMCPQRMRLYTSPLLHFQDSWMVV